MMKRLVGALAVILLLCGCGVGAGGEGAAGSSAFPADTVQDWVTYGDYLVEVVAVSEQTLSPDENELFEGEGMFRREFTLEVATVLWTRHGVRHRAPTTETMVSGGWQFRNGNLDRRKRVDASHQLVVGRHYVAVLTHDGRGEAEGGSAWWNFSTLPVENGAIVGWDGDTKTEVRRALVGLTPQQAGALLRRTDPDPKVVPYLDEDAVDRYQLSVAETSVPATPGPGER